MNRPDEQDDRLENHVKRLVRGLPDRRVPAGFEARVLGLLESRAVAPWWRTAFVVWPATARVAFVVLCLALGLSTVLLGRAPALEAPSLWFEQSLNVASFVTASWTLFARLVPDAWVYAALGLGGALYALLFGLGAVVYRTLYLPSFTR